MGTLNQPVLSNECSFLLNVTPEFELEPYMLSTHGLLSKSCCHSCVDIINMTRMFYFCCVCIFFSVSLTFRNLMNAIIDNYSLGSTRGLRNAASICLIENYTHKYPLCKCLQSCVVNLDFRLSVLLYQVQG